MALTWTITQLVGCAILILLSGVRLARYGDAIAARTGLGGTWVGLVMLASVTSLPELVTGASAIVLHDVPDIAVGDAIGSCAFNLLILALLDVRHAGFLSARIHAGHVLPAALGIVLLGLVALAVQVGSSAPMVGWVAWHSLGLVAAYAVALRTVFTFERSRTTGLTRPHGDSGLSGRPTLRRAVTLYVVNAAVLAAAAMYLPGLASDLAAATGLAQSVVGGLFVAATTSLPEAVVSAAAARAGALDMAAANLFGSNLFNVAVIGFDDLLYTSGSLLAATSPKHMVMLLSAMSMTAVAIVGLVYRGRQRQPRVSWDALGMIGIYALAVILLA